MHSFLKDLWREVSTTALSLARWLYPTHFWKIEAQNQHRFSPRVYVMLRAAGWYPGRSVDLPACVNPGDYHSKALELLHEFGDLYIGKMGVKYPESDYCASDVQVFVDDDWDIECEEERKAYASLSLCDVGMLCYTIPFFVDASGYIYKLSNGIEPVGPNFDRALELILIGIKPNESDLVGARRFVQVDKERYLFREA